MGIVDGAVLTTEQLGELDTEDNAPRCGAEVIPVSADWGRIIEPEAIEAALKTQKRVKLPTLVHAKTTTGVLQPLIEASQLAGLTL